MLKRYYVVLSAIEIPFMDLVFFLVKLQFAGIIAGLLIVALIFGITFLMFGWVPNVPI